MKQRRKGLTLILMMLLLILMPATALAQSITVTYQNEPITQVINDLRQKTGYEFVYLKEVVADVPPITCSAEGTADDVFELIFGDIAGLDYEVVKKSVILRKSTRRPFLKRTITGTVLDENEQPLPGVNIMQRGTKTGCISDIDGQFSILINGRDPVLTFSYIGMESQELRIHERTKNFVVIRMTSAENLMEEVLVTGYQNLKREAATGSYQTITAEDMDARYTGNIVGNLEGKVPGLVTYNNGSNGEGEQQITIRGTGSFQARTNPLVVVDGLPIEGSIESVNPYDIENITVLKDASAASIYGARASNGVIVITTKRAQSEKLTVDFSTDITISEKQRYGNYHWADASQMLQLERYNFDNVVASEGGYSTLTGAYKTNPHSLSTASYLFMQHHLGLISDTDYNNTLDAWSRNDYRREWRDAMLRTQVTHQYNVALRNKGKVVNSSIVINYKGDNNGIVNEKNNALMMSYRGDLSPAKWLDLSFGVNIMQERARNQADLFGYKSINSFQPYQSMYNADGSRAAMEAAVWLDEPSLSNESLGLKSEVFNLLDELDMNYQNTRRTTTRSFVHADFKILPELDILTQFQYEDINYDSDTHYKGESYDMRHLYNLFTSGGTHYIPEGGMLQTQNERGAYYTFRAQANYNKTFRDKHDVEALLGFEYRDTHTRSKASTLYGYDEQTQTNTTHLVNFDALQYLTTTDLGENYSPSGSAPTEDNYRTTDVLHRYYSIYFTGNYTYDRRYSASFSYRVDNTDLFGADAKFRRRPLWSIGGSWNMHNEKFMQPASSWLDVLKLRFSYGLTGNIDQSVSSFLTAAISVNNLSGDKMATLNTPPNDDLRWEKTASWNVGLDFSLFRNRLSGSIDWYHKLSSDLLTVTDLDPTTGWTSLTINNGEAVNTGVEFQLNGEILRPVNDGLGINASLSFSYNKNEVKKIEHLPASGYEALYSLHEGYPINSIFSYRYAGMVTGKGEEGSVPAYGWYDSEGNIQAVDIASNLFTVDDVVYCGGRDPKYVGSFTPEITYKGFTLSAMLSYYGGHYMRARAEDWSHEGTFSGYSENELGGIPSSYLNYWTTADNGKLVPNGYPAQSIIGNYEYMDANVVRADYLKVRNIVLGYNFPRRWCEKVHANSIRLRVQMNNVATWKRNNLGVDPEANDPYSGATLDKTPRSYTMSLNVNF